MIASPFESTVDGGSVRVFRMFLGIAGILVGVEHLEIVHDLEQSGVQYPRWLWLPELPLQLHRYAAVLAMVSSLLVAVNILPRLSGWTTAAILTANAIYDPRLFSNHTWLTAILMFVAALAETGRGARSYWPIWLCKIQFSLVYFFAALTKVNPDFLSGASLYLMLRPKFALVLEQVPETVLPKLFALLAVATVVMELGVAIALWMPRYRQAAVLVGILFHACLTFALPAAHQLGILIFDVLFLGTYFLFLKAQPQSTPSNI